MEKRAVQQQHKMLAKKTKVYESFKIARNMTIAGLSSDEDTYFCCITKSPDFYHSLAEK